MGFAGQKLARMEWVNGSTFIAANLCEWEAIEIFCEFLCFLWRSVWLRRCCFEKMKYETY